MNARDLMTPDVVTVLPDMPVVALARMLADRGISAAPVTDAQRRVLGIVSEGDLLRHIAGEDKADLGFFGVLFSDPHRLASEYAKTHGKTARNVMTSNLVSVTPDTPVEEVAKLMAKRNVRRVLVMEGDKLLGIVSRADLLRAILSPPPSDGTASDDTIRKAIIAEMRRQPWVNTYFVTVLVKDGVAELHGLVGSEEIQRGLEALAAAVPGVKRVENRTEVGPMLLY